MLPTVGLSLSFHVFRVPTLRLSSACGEVLGRQRELWPGRLVDLLFIVGTIGTCATGLGFGTSVVSAAVNRLTGIEDGIGLQIGVIAAAGATRYLQADQHLVRLHRVFWAFALGSLPLSLLFLGGLRELQTASLLASLPILLVYGILAVSISRMLNRARAPR